MTIDRVFYGYMLLVGLATGGVLTAAPQIGDFWIKPYFWILIAVGLFEVGTTLYRLVSPGPLMAMQARLIGFGIGIAGMVALPTMTGSPAHFL